MNEYGWDNLLFQFHKGAIKTLLFCHILLALFHFNSIKVRLKLSQATFPRFVTKFQFHKGAIKTTMTFSLYLTNYLFQFHKGAIKTIVKGLNTFCYILFQFHKGAIKTDLTVKTK